MTNPKNQTNREQDKEHIHEFGEEEAVLVKPVDGTPPYEIMGRFCKTCPTMFIEEFSQIVSLKAHIQQ